MLADTADQSQPQAAGEDDVDTGIMGSSIATIFQVANFL